jgi:hypothetical protein
MKWGNITSRKKESVQNNQIKVIAIAIETEVKIYLANIVEARVEAQKGKLIPPCLRYLG